MTTVRKKILKLTQPIHHKLRDAKLDIFFSLLLGQTQDTLLDVGGHSGINGEFLRLYKRFASVTLVNVEFRKMQVPPNVSLRFVVGDGCKLPFPSQSFDWVFSNAVIEHVGDFERQKKFAAEIRRVARKGYFVTTPNKYFPIEPHTYLPLYQFMPAALQKKVIRFAPAWIHDYESACTVELLTPHQFRGLFPDALVEKVGFPVFPNSLIAYQRFHVEAASPDSMPNRSAASSTSI